MLLVMSVKSDEKSEVASKKVSLAILPLCIFTIAVSVFLVAQFLLGSWAETSELNHTIQHVIIFVAGCGVGGSLISSLLNK